MGEFQGHTRGSSKHFVHNKRNAAVGSQTLIYIIYDLMSSSLEPRTTLLALLNEEAWERDLSRSWIDGRLGVDTNIPLPARDMPPARCPLYMAPLPSVAFPLPSTKMCTAVVMTYSGPRTFKWSHESGKYSYKRRCPLYGAVALAY